MEKFLNYLEHTERLFYSAKRMGMTVPYSVDEINKSTKQIVEIQKTQNGYVDQLYGVEVK